jgi:hypothetical protein
MLHVGMSIKPLNCLLKNMGGCMHMLLHGSLQLHASIQVDMLDVSSFMRSCHIKLFDS